MFKPLEKLIVTQPFGANPQYYKQFGFSGHEGVDFKTTNLGTSQGWFANLMGWQKLFAPVSGKVTVDYSGPYGTHIYVQDKDGNRFLFAHLKNARCSSGDTVAEGQLIGVTGRSGGVTGPHLHVSYRPVGFDLLNGYLGNIDPLPLFQKRFVMDYTVINADPSICEQAKAILQSLAPIEMTFKYVNLAEVKVNGLFDTDAQIQFLRVHPIQTRFGYVKYTSLTDVSGYDFARTNSVPGLDLVLTTSENISPLNLAYEFVNALTDYVLDRGYPVPYLDINTPDMAFLKKKVDNVVPILSNLS